MLGLCNSVCMFVRVGEPVDIDVKFSSNWMSNHQIDALLRKSAYSLVC